MTQTAIPPENLPKIEILADESWNVIYAKMHIQKIMTSPRMGLDNKT